MKTYPIPMVPGPVCVPDVVREIYRINFGSGDLEPDYIELYCETENNLRKLMNTQNQVVIQTGEGMLALWGALKSCLVPGDRVLALSTGLFGLGIGDMAKTIGADVRILEFPFDETLSGLERLEAAIAEFHPKMITVVHCETPSGTLNPVADVGKLKRKYGIPLLYVDGVSSIGGVSTSPDDWGIDLFLGGSQKVLSTPPGMSFISVSEPAWSIIDKVDYAGYDAIKPFRTAVADAYFPYTPYWHGTAMLNEGVKLLLEEGLQNVFRRHEQIAAYCHERLAKIGLNLYPKPEAIQSPTVTAVCVPEQITWDALNKAFRAKGLVVGGNYGPLAGKVFRIGHMGSQADRNLVEQAMDVIESVIQVI